MRRKLIPLYLALGVMILACNDSAKEVADLDSKPVNFSTSYIIPEFEDVERLEKISEALSKAGEIFMDCAEQNHLPGIAYGIVVDNTLINSGGYGTINLSTNKAVTNQSLFRIASMTKSFTAMAILKLRDEGQLRLHDPIAKYIPALTDLVYLTEDATPVTIYNLLTMTAGFPEDNPWGDRFLDIKDEELMDLVGSGISFSSVPSSQYEYSNLGYGLLGNIISRISGIPYQEYITGNILEPLEMKNTCWEYANVPDSLFALGYRWKDGAWEKEPVLHDGAFGAMGGLITSIEDFSKYVSFHLSVWPPSNGPETGPVKRSTVREMQRMTKPNLYTGIYRFGNPDGSAMRGYGFGLTELKDHLGIVEVGHGGGLPGFGSSYVFYPDHGIGIMAFANRKYSGGAVKQAIYQVIQTLIEQELFNPRVLPVSDILTERQDQVVQLIQHWDPVLEEEILAKNFYLDRSREDRMQDAAKALSSVGEITSIDPVVPENQLRGSFLIHGKKGSAEVSYTLTPESTPRVQWLSFHH